MQSLFGISFVCLTLGWKESTDVLAFQIAVSDGGILCNCLQRTIWSSCDGQLDRSCSIILLVAGNRLGNIIVSFRPVRESHSNVQ